LAATFAAEVTTFGVAALFARPVLGAGLLLVATAGASPAVAFGRRTALEEGLGETTSVAVTAGVGLPTMAAVCELAVSCRRVAVEAAATSVADDAVVVARGVSLAAVAFGKLGAFA
jgi:hypothetical protein